MSTAEPESKRSFGFLDHFALWASLGVTLYIMPFGSLLVPSLSLWWAFVAVLMASLLATAALGAVAAIAAHERKTSAGLLSSLFGERSMPLVATLLLARNVAWGALALVLIADSAALVSERALGVSLRPVWVLVFAAAGLALVLAGPQFVIRTLLKRLVVWIVLLVALGITLSAYLEFGIPTYLQRPATGGWPSVWQGMDVMLIVALLWLPVVADYARQGKGVRSTAAGTMAGFFVGTLWMGYLGVVYLPAVDTADIPGFVVTMQLGLGALILLMLLQLDEVFANTYSGGLALSRLIPVPFPAAGALGGAAVIALIFPFGATGFEGTLLVIGSLFVPLFGVLFADRALSALGAAEWDGAPVIPVTAWGAGFLVFHWIAPTDVAWWQSLAERLYSDLLRLPFPLTDEVAWLGAVVPSMLIAGALTAGLRLGSAMLRRGRPALEGAA
jgi:nucleobase:cation symporter-1, NCS1 family